MDIKNADMALYLWREDKNFTGVERVL